MLLKLLVFHVLEHLLLNGSFELLVIIDVLGNPVDCIFKCPNVNFVRVDFDFGPVNHLLHLLLADAQAVDQIAQLGIGLVELSQLLVHPVCVVLQVGDFLLSWSDVLFELFDFVIKHVLEFFELLSLFLELVNLLFAFANSPVFLGQLGLQLTQLYFLLVSDLLLLFNLLFLV